MGKIQCVSTKGNNNDIWGKIEKDLEKRNTYFERALLHEYKDIKLMLEYSDKVKIINIQLTRVIFFVFNYINNYKDLQKLNKSEIYSYVDKRKKVSRFIKWYKLAFEEDVPINKRTNYSSIKQNNLQNNFFNSIKFAERIDNNSESDKNIFDINNSVKFNTKFSSMYNKTNDKQNNNFISPIRDNKNKKKDDKEKKIQMDNADTDIKTNVYNSIIKSNEKQQNKKDWLKFYGTDIKIEVRKDTFTKEKSEIDMNKDWNFSKI